MPSVWKGKLFAEGAGETDLCLYAQRFPGFNAARDQLENNRRVRARHAAMRVVDYMVKHAESCEQIWASLETGLVHLSTDEASSSAGQGSATNPGFFPGIATFGKLATTARASALAAIPGGPVSKVLDRMDDADKHSIGDLFFLVFGLSKADKIPMFESDAHYAHTMRLRVKQTNFDIATWLGTCVKENGAVDWAAMPLWDTRWSPEGLLTKITYGCTTDVPIPSHVVITNDWRLVNPSSHFEAAFVLETTTHLLASFCAPGVGPQRIALDKKV